MIQFLSFYPLYITQKAQIWCPEPSDVAQTKEQRGHYMDIYSGSLVDVKERLNSQTASKARAMSYMCKYFGIYRHNILVAGNAMNDVDMLNIETKYRIPIGLDSKERRTIIGIYLRSYLDTPEALGRFCKHYKCDTLNKSVADTIQSHEHI